MRRGVMSDLPMLAEAEFGYALDEQRLFIGNQELTVGTGDDSRVSFQLPTTSMSFTSATIVVPRVFIDGIQQNPSDFSIAGTVITFNSPPALNSTITIKYNTEIETFNNTIRYNTLALAQTTNGNQEDTTFKFDTSVFDTCFLDYSIDTGQSQFSSGQIRILARNNVVAIDDNFNLLWTGTGPAPTRVINFDGNIDGNGIFTLTYQSNEFAPSTFYYTMKLWKM